jgi:hypothetical protein
MQYRDLQVPDADLILIGGARVTTPERTLADLARTDDAQHRRAFELLADAEPGLASAALEWLEAQGPIWAKRAGKEILRARAQDEVTRYTS